MTRAAHLPSLSSRIPAFFAGVRDPLFPFWSAAARRRFAVVFAVVFAVALAVALALPLQWPAWLPGYHS